MSERNKSFHDYSHFLHFPATIFSMKLFKITFKRLKEISVFKKSFVEKRLQDERITKNVFFNQNGIQILHVKWDLEKHFDDSKASKIGFQYFKVNENAT